MINGIWQSLRLDVVNINVYAKFSQTIPKGSRDRAIVSLFRIWISAKPRPMTNDIWQSLDLVNINVYAKFHHNIPLSSRERTIITFSWFGPRIASTDDKCHFASLRLDLVNINVYAKFYQNIPNGSIVMGIFRKLSGKTQLHKLSRDLGVAATETNVILQSLGLDFVTINVSAKFCQTIPKSSRVMGIFRKLTGDTQLGTPLG